MDKIIKVTDDKVLVGTKSGGIIEVRRCDLSFEPVVGDTVNVFISESETIIVKAQEPKTQEKQEENQGINININNQNASGNTGAFDAQGGKKVVNKVAYVLLAFFLGGLGIHKFYAGKTVAGILYILFCWSFIPSIIAFVEAIIGLTKTADAYGNIVV